MRNLNIVLWTSPELKSELGFPCLSDTDTSLKTKIVALQGMRRGKVNGLKR